MDETRRPVWLEQALAVLREQISRGPWGLLEEGPEYAISPADLDLIVLLHAEAKRLGIEPADVLRAVIAARKEKLAEGRKSSPGPPRDRRREEFYFRVFPILRYLVDLSKAASKMRNRSSEEQQQRLREVAVKCHAAHLARFGMDPQKSPPDEKAHQADVEWMIRRNSRLLRGGRRGPRSWSHRAIAVERLNELSWVKEEGGFQLSEWKPAEQAYRGHPLVAFRAGRGRLSREPETLEHLRDAVRHLQQKRKRTRDVTPTP